VESIAEANTEAKVVAYLSVEFLTGPHLGNGPINLGIWQAVEEALSRVGQDLSGLLEQEEEPGLGNGGLGRLAACYMDSLATLNVPAIGYGIRYEFGIFDQVIRDGGQVEVTDKWLRFGNSWEIVRSEIACDVKFDGRTKPYYDDEGRYRVRWAPDKVVKGVAYDTPVPGYRVPTTNLLRLWKAEAAESFDFQAFNVGDYYRAVEEKVASETISKILYPNTRTRSESSTSFATWSRRSTARALRSFWMLYSTTQQKADGPGRRCAIADWRMTSITSSRRINPVTPTTPVAATR
jgi:starch phosphorylase